MESMAIFLVLILVLILAIGSFGLGFVACAWGYQMLAAEGDLKIQNGKLKIVR